MRLYEAFNNPEFIEALDELDFWSAFKMLEYPRDREQLFLSLQSENEDPLDGFKYIPTEFLVVCDKIKEINIPDSVEVIQDAAFYRCAALEKVTMKNSIIYISDDAFKKCESLKEIRLSNKLQELGSRVFLGCSNLETVHLPKTLQTLDKEVFAGCFNLSNIIYDGTKSDWKLITKGSRWRTFSNQLRKITCTDGFIYLSK